MRGESDSRLADDRREILDGVGQRWEALRGKRVFITGGTGFFGCWLLEGLTAANDALDLEVEAVVLSRDPGKFAAKAPHLAGHRAVRLQQGDVRSFTAPDGHFDFLIHAATEADATLNREQPKAMLATIVDGTREVLRFATAAGVQRLLLTSSGAVYGPQPSAVTHVAEDYLGAPDSLDPAAAYGLGKRLAEFTCAQWGRETGAAAVIARCFAFVGPYLPLDKTYAVGNFIADGMAGRAIEITGDGTTYRSYLYAAELAAWLWVLLVDGSPGRAYNVGSGEALTVAELAARVARCFTPPPLVVVRGRPVPGQAPARYVPAVERVQSEFGLVPHVSLSDALSRTLAWHRAGV